MQSVARHGNSRSDKPATPVPLRYLYSRCRSIGHAYFFVSLFCPRISGRHCQPAVSSSRTDSNSEHRLTAPYRLTGWSSHLSLFRRAFLCSPPEIQSCSRRQVFGPPTHACRLAPRCEPSSNPLSARRVDSFLRQDLRIPSHLPQMFVRILKIPRVPTIERIVRGLHNCRARIPNLIHHRIHFRS